MAITWTESTMVILVHQNLTCACLQLDGGFISLIEKFIQLNLFIIICSIIQLLFIFHTVNHFSTWNYLLSTKAECVLSYYIIHLGLLYKYIIYNLMFSPGLYMRLRWMFLFYIIPVSNSTIGNIKISDGCFCVVYVYITIGTGKPLKSKTRKSKIFGNPNKFLRK